MFAIYSNELESLKPMSCLFFNTYLFVYIPCPLFPSDDFARFNQYLRTHRVLALTTSSSISTFAKRHVLILRPRCYKAVIKQMVLPSSTSNIACAILKIFHCSIGDRLGQAAC